MMSFEDWITKSVNCSSSQSSDLINTCSININTCSINIIPLLLSYEPFFVTGFLGSNI